MAKGKKRGGRNATKTTITEEMFGGGQELVQDVQDCHLFDNKPLKEKTKAEIEKMIAHLMKRHQQGIELTHFNEYFSAYYGEPLRFKEEGHGKIQSYLLLFKSVFLVEFSAESIKVVLPANAELPKGAHPVGKAVDNRVQEGNFDKNDLLTEEEKWAQWEQDSNSWDQTPVWKAPAAPAKKESSGGGVIRDKIRELVEEHSGGLNLSEFGKTYQAYFNESLNVKMLGYATLKKFLLRFPDIVKIRPLTPLSSLILVLPVHVNTRLAALTNHNVQLPDSWESDEEMDEDGNSLAQTPQPAQPNVAASNPAKHSAWGQPAKSSTTPSGLPPSAAGWGQSPREAEAEAEGGWATVDHKQSKGKTSSGWTSEKNTAQSQPQSGGWSNQSQPQSGGWSNQSQPQSKASVKITLEEELRQLLAKYDRTGIKLCDFGLKYNQEYGHALSFKEKGYGTLKKLLQAFAKKGGVLKIVESPYRTGLEVVVPADVEPTSLVDF
eukprot:GCRY01002600.1.p1 GENE.GCRY01002600.1~~GCRY01002600.1.p1  ORF type:complete len:492 (-),score=105.04 GCRY01002600.1:59-1534(-)